MPSRNMVARLPTVEITLCFLVWIVHSFAAFYVAWNVSSTFRYKMVLKASEYINGYQRDHTDAEWEFYSKSLSRILIINTLHMVLFKICPVLLPKKLSQCLLLVFWILAEIFFTSATCVVIVFTLAVVMGIIANYWRSELVYWFTLIMLIVKIHSIMNFSKVEDVYYREFNYYLYSAVKILNFCIHLSRTKDISISPSLFFRYIQYIFYPPYSIVLIVLFNDFDAEMTEIENGSMKCINYRILMIRLVRIIAWFIAFEIILHFIHVHAVLVIGPALFDTLNEYEIASVSYVNGKLFYMKYLLIFGIPSWFALADGMKPPAGPICISRIGNYSQMWRSFDRGLYIFLKKQLYIPVSGDPSSKYFLLRRFGALGTVFLFVLAWHGTSSNYFYWVLLNSLEICMEWFGVAISKTAFYSKIRNFLGPRGERRLIAFSMITTVVPGIMGVFFFLSRREIGIIIFKRLCINLIGTIMQFTLNLPNRLLYYYAVSAHFIVLGYCFNHVCLELEKYYAVKQVSGDEVKQKIL
uniref:MBOAT family protein n=1 Tax=Wuchereria bancrofti TaxID=6293 RepID=A0AAF5PHL9_WUCBA